MSDTKLLFLPTEIPELLSGWLLHAHKERDRHDYAARRYEGRRFILGSIAIALSAAVGTSVFASLATAAKDPWIAVAVGLASVAATVLTALSTFLDYAGRAQRHRKAAAACKSIVHEIEQAFATIQSGGQVDHAGIQAIRTRFDTIESETPVVLSAVYGEIQREYRAVHFVQKAEELYPADSQ